MVLFTAPNIGKHLSIIFYKFPSLGNAQGDILVNGKTVDRNFMNHISGFVPQQDLAVDSLTVGEHMEFMVMSTSQCLSVITLCSY